MRIIMGIVLFCCLSIFVFAESNYDQDFDKGKELFNAGNFEAAVPYLEKAAQDNPNIIDPYLDIGICYLKSNQLAKAINAFSRVINIFPNDWRGYYYLAASYVSNGEIAKALQNYNRAKELGIKGEDFVEKLLVQYQPKDLNVEYHPLFGNSENKNITILIKGNSCADKELILDTIRQLEKMEFMKRRSIFTEIDVEFVQWEKDQSIAKEKWVVKNQQGQREYWVNYNFTPPAGFPSKTMITVSEKE